MTPKAEALLDAVTCVTKPCDHHLVSEPLRLLVAYIEELERKAAEHDALMAMQTEESDVRAQD